MRSTTMKDISRSTYSVCRNLVHGACSMQERGLGPCAADLLEENRRLRQRLALRKDATDFV